MKFRANIKNSDKIVEGVGVTKCDLGYVLFTKEIEWVDGSEWSVGCDWYEIDENTIEIIY